MRVLLAPSDVPSNNPKYWDKLAFPLLGSPKLDGIRMVTSPDPDGVVNAMTRTWKLIPSYQVQDMVQDLPAWLDGELIEGEVTDFGVYNRTQSHVMSAEREGFIHYYVFDYAHPAWRDRPYEERLHELYRIVSSLDLAWLHVVPQTPLLNLDQLLAFENEQLELGYEGVMLRTYTGRYKEGRATINEAIIYKLKRFLDAEGVVSAFVEREINNNEKVLDERGYAKRSSHQAGKQAAGTLGKFKVEFEGRTINVAPGTFSHQQLQEIWDDKESYVGSLLKFRYFAHGVKCEPRHARAIGWRNQSDL